ncbi:MAG TPA: TolC family protein [Longimicrobiales bacterium]|nr:TolC family protein [Longimicrobiales bacterium]
MTLEELKIAMLLKAPGRTVRVSRAVALVAFLLLPAASAAQQAPRVMTLDQVVRLAVERDPAAVAAEGALSSARADRLQQTGAWLPSLNVNSFYSNSSNERFDQATGRLQSESYSAQVQGGMDLFTGGRRLLAQRTVNAQVSAADAQYASQRFNTILAATEAFYEAAAARDLMAVAAQRLERARGQLSVAQTRLELGTSTQSDALRAEIEVGNAEVALLEAESAMRNSTLELGRRVGIAGQIQPADAALPDSAPELPSLDVLVQQATTSSPSVTAAEATLRSRRSERLASFTPYLPTLRMTGGYDWSSFDFPPRDRSWSMRLTASLPVFNGFQREAAIQRTAANERIAEARARDATIAARVAVESAAAEIASAERRVTIADRSVVLAREDLRVQEERYEIGMATILELQTSQVALSDAEIAAVRARQALGTATARLEAILGQTLREDG